MASHLHRKGVKLKLNLAPSRLCSEALDLFKSLAERDAWTTRRCRCGITWVFDSNFHGCLNNDRFAE